MTGIEGNLTGRPVHPTCSAKPSNRVFRQITQINALRREGYTIKEIAVFFNTDPSTISLRTYGIANDNNVFQKQGMNNLYRQMHRGACCHLDYYFLGIGDFDHTSPAGLKFGSKFRKELYAKNDEIVRREVRIRTKQRKFKILGDKLNA